MPDEWTICRGRGLNPTVGAPVIHGVERNGCLGFDSLKPSGVLALDLLQAFLDLARIGIPQTGFDPIGDVRLKDMKADIGQLRKSDIIDAVSDFRS